MTRASVAMTNDLDLRARGHLLRQDGQEDVCLATYARSSGVRRTTAVVTDLVLPLDGERSVHGNASFSGRYVVRAASLAAAQGRHHAADGGRAHRAAAGQAGRGLPDPYRARLRIPL